jgi:superkiller protein 3
MTVEEMERRFFELKGKLNVGAITEQEFKSEVEKLRFQDKQERWWMIGAQSGKWYVREGTRWMPGKPPSEPPPSPPPPLMETPPPPPVQSSKESLSAASRTVGKPKARSVPGFARPERSARAPVALPKLPITGIVLIVGAGLVALIAVFLLWFAVDNFVPGKPISSFLGGLVGGGKPRTTLTPTPVAGQNNASRDVSALIAMGDQLLVSSRVDAAIMQYQNAAQLAPTDPLPLTRWSRALAFRGQMQDALAKAQQAVQRAPNDAEAQAQLCRVLTWNGQFDDAIRAGEKAFQLDSNSVSARAYLSEAYLHARRPTDALAQAQVALRLAPQNTEAHRAQAWVLTLQGQKDAAFAEWKQTAMLEPDFYFRRYELGEVMRVYLNNPADAISEYQKSIALYGAYIPAVSRLGLALLDVRKPQEAVTQFRRAVTLDPNNAEGYTYLGIAFGQANQCAQAIPYFEQALKLDPNNSLAQRGLVDCRSGKAPNVPAPAPQPVPLIPPPLVPKR